MKKLAIFGTGLGLVLLLATTGIVIARQSQRPSSLANTGFTYQGVLDLNGTRVNGACTFEFDLFDVPTGGNPLATITQTNVPVTNGLFTVILDFGLAPFDGGFRHLETSVDCPGGSGLTMLLPRQKLEAVPYALFAGQSRWDTLIGVPAGFADDVDNDTQYSAGSGLSLTGTTFSADTSFLQKRVTGQCSVGSSIRVINANGTVTCETDDTGGIADGAVTTAKIANLAVTNAKIANDAVTNVKIANDAVGSSELAPNSDSLVTRPV